MIDQTPWIQSLNGFLSLLNSGNENFEFDYEEENECDTDEDDDNSYNESRDEDCKDIFV